MGEATEMAADNRWEFSFKEKIIAAVVLLILLAVGAGIYFYPQPIIKDMQKARVCTLEYRIDGELSYTEGYDEAAVLQALSTARIRRTLNTAGPYQLDNEDIIIVLDDGVNLKEVRLGRENYCSKGGNSTLCDVLDPEELYKQLSAAIHS